MSQFSYKKNLLIVAGVLSLTAQVILCLPAMSGLSSQSLPNAWGSLAIGMALFLGSLLLVLVALRAQFVKNRSAWYLNGVLLLTQIFTVMGTFLLLNGSAPYERWIGLFLSSLVTVLTTYGIFSHATVTVESQPAPFEEIRSPFDFPTDPDLNIHALR